MAEKKPNKFKKKLKVENTAPTSIHSLIEARLITDELCKEDIWDAIKDFYDEADTPELRVVATIMNSIVHQKRAVFIISRRLLHALIKKDPNWKARGITTSFTDTQYGAIIGKLKEPKIVKCERTGRGQAPSVFRVIDEDWLSYFIEAGINVDTQSEETRQFAENRDHLEYDPKADPAKQSESHDENGMQSSDSNEESASNHNPNHNANHKSNQGSKCEVQSAKSEGQSVKCQVPGTEPVAGNSDPSSLTFPSAEKTAARISTEAVARAQKEAQLEAEAKKKAKAEEEARRKILRDKEREEMLAMLPPKKKVESDPSKDYLGSSGWGTGKLLIHTKGSRRDARLQSESGGYRLGPDGFVIGSGGIGDDPDEDY